MVYVNMKGKNGIETVDEFDTLKEAKAMVKEYRMSDTYNTYYLSQRSTKDWMER